MGEIKTVVFLVVMSQKTQLAAIILNIWGLEKIITVRHLDDAGKDPNLETSDFWYFAPLVQRVVEEKVR